MRRHAVELVLAIVAALALAAGCQRADTAEHSAAVTRDRAARSPVAAGATVSVPEPVAAAATTPSCGGACGGSCGGGASCTGGCGAVAGADSEAAPVPADAVWTQLHVAGMRCGGCARRIKGALARVDGVLGVEVDVPTAQVRVATAAGVDGRTLAQPAIDALGYQVQSAQ
jgi:copper chaperone CopZ